MLILTVFAIIFIFVINRNLNALTAVDSLYIPEGYLFVCIYLCVHKLYIMPVFCFCFLYVVRTIRCRFYIVTVSFNHSIHILSLKH